MSARSSLWSPRWLDLLSGGVALAAVALLVWPVSVTTHPSTPSVPAPAEARAPDIVDSAAAQIVSGNVFSATRRAPSVRFVPPGSALEAPPVPDAAPAATTTASVEGEDAGPRLFGIVAQDGERRALLQLPGPDSTPRLLAVGARQGGYRVLSISTDRVVLATPAGSRTLRLVARATSDSSEKTP